MLNQKVLQRFVFNFVVTLKLVFYSSNKLTLNLAKLIKLK